MQMPSEVTRFFENGGFVVSIKGRHYHFVGIDEAHEMLINKQTKQAIVRPTKDYINRIAQYIPFRTKIVNKVRVEILPLTKEKAEATFSPFTKDTVTQKSEGNVQTLMKKISEVRLLPVTTLNRGLVNPFRKITANEAQRHDLLNFHQIGQKSFEDRILACILKKPSTKVPLRRKRLQTFGNAKQSSHKEKSLQKEVQKCIRCKIAYANQTGTSVDTVAEQYIELPRALCDTNGVLNKGQKNVATKFYEARYNNKQDISAVHYKMVGVLTP